MARRLLPFVSACSRMWAQLFPERSSVRIQFSMGQCPAPKSRDSLVTAECSRSSPPRPVCPVRVPHPAMPALGAIRQMIGRCSHVTPPMRAGSPWRLLCCVCRPALRPEGAASC